MVLRNVVELLNLDKGLAVFRGIVNTRINFVEYWTISKQFYWAFRFLHCILCSTALHRFYLFYRNARFV